MENFGIDTSILPFSAVSRETIAKARAILGSLQGVIEEDQKMGKLGMKADLGKLL